MTTPITAPSEISSEPDPAPLDLTVVACAHDEAPYLLEWIAWHVLIGVGRFVIFSHGCTDDTDAMLDRLAEIGPLEHVRQPSPPDGTPFDVAALELASAMPAVRLASWVLPLAIDEFVDVSAGYGTLAELLETLTADDAEDGAGDGAVDAIPLLWRHMGSQGEAAFGTAPVTERFCMGSRISPPEAPRLVGFRTLFRPARFARMRPSRPWGRAEVVSDESVDARRAGKPVWRNASGADVSRAMAAQNARDQRLLPVAALGFEHACIRRYAVKSRTEFLHRQLSDAPPPEGPRGPQGWDAWLMRDINSMSLSPLGPGVLRDAIAELEADRVLSDLQDAARTRLQRRVDALTVDQPIAQRFLETGETGQTDPPAPHVAGERTTRRLLCVATHPRAGTMWLRRTVHEAAKALKVPVATVEHPRDLRDLPTAGPVIVVNWQGRFPLPLFTRDDASILHVIRDPRDMLISAMEFHRVVTRKEDASVHEPRPNLSGMSDQDYLNGLPDAASRLRFEMASRHKDVTDTMLSWALTTTGAIELRYEDLLNDSDCTLMASALERCAIQDLDTNTLLASYWNHALFGGLSDSTRIDDRLRRHIGSAQPGRWRQEMPHEVAILYERRHGLLLRKLGYASDPAWVDEAGGAQPEPPSADHSASA